VTPVGINTVVSRLPPALCALAAIFVLSAWAAPDDASARACADRHVEFEAAPSRVREALLCEVARVRERRDLRRLRGDEQLDLAATRHAVDMQERRYFSHVSPGGGDLADRAARAGYAVRRCSWRVGEVLAWGVGARATAAGTIRAWMRSPGHRRVLLSRRYREVGVGLQAGTPHEQYPSGLTAAVVVGSRDC
jgi:uncharacterized protein YkwD